MDSASPAWATFPLFGVSPEGRCTCGDSACKRPGKHPMYAYSMLGPGERVPGPDGSNTAIATGVRSGVFVVDFDTVDAYAALADKLPQTYAVRTGRGVHLYFQTPDFAVRNSVGELAPKVDVRGEGGFVVAAGSRHASGTTYEALNDIAPAPAPAWLFEWPGLRGKEPANGAPGANAPVPVDVDTPEGGRRLKLGTERAKTAPPSIEGQDGSGKLWDVCLYLVRRLELPLETCVELVSEQFNPRCVPPWSEAEIRHKLENARDCSNMPPGIAPEGFGRKLAEMAARGEDTAPAVSIEITSDLHQNTGDACRAIGDDPDVYQRGGRLVRIVRVAEAKADAAHVAGTPTIRPMEAATLKVRLTKVANWTRERLLKNADGTTGWKHVQTKPDEDIVAGVLNSGHWPSTRVLAGVTETPIVRPDGTVLQAPGYDAATGYLYEPPAHGFPRVPEQPTRDDARRALVSLLEVFEDFPYANDLSRVVPIAALLSILARPSIRGSVPGFLFEASTRGSGKSLQADAISLIATGRSVGKVTWPEKDEELEKILSAYALQGAALFCFDNVAAAFGGAALDKVLTCDDAVDFRILGKTQVQQQIPWRAVVLSTANNPVFRGDTARRVLVSRLEPKEENPEERTGFTHPDLRGWVRQERARLVIAALTLLRAYFAAGCPDKVTPKGSFEAWSAIVPSALVWAGCPNVIEAKPAEGADMEKDALRDLLTMWPEGKAFTARELFDKVSGHFAGLGSDPFRDALRDVFGEVRTAKAAAGKLRRLLGRVINGRKLDNRDHDGHDKVAKWAVTRAA